MHTLYKIQYIVEEIIFSNFKQLPSWVIKYVPFTKCDFSKKNSLQNQQEARFLWTYVTFIPLQNSSTHIASMQPTFTLFYASSLAIYKKCGKFTIWTFFFWWAFVFVSLDTSTFFLNWVSVKMKRKKIFNIYTVLANKCPWRTAYI